MPATLSNSTPREVILTEAPEPTLPGSDFGLRDQSDASIVLSWLTWLRWIALGGQISALLFAAFALGVSLPLAGLLAPMALTAATNVLLILRLRRQRPPSAYWVPMVLLVDVLLLSVMLAETGGPQNPFCALYLIHVAMAVTVLPPRQTWIIVAASIGCYALLFAWHVPLEASSEIASRVFRVGAWLCMTISAIVIAYFIGRVRSALHAKEQRIARMQRRIQHNERVATLATLAAGAAHELGTPLGTIAVVSHELLRAAERNDLSQATRDDLALIRREVQHCREILDNMNLDSIHQFDDTWHSVRIDAVVDALRQELRPEEAERLKVDLAPDVGAIFTLGAPLLQALAIVVHNAFDASGPHDVVELGVGQRQNKMHWSVIDHGVGMTAEQVAQLGQPFASSKAPHEGMGLGLFLASLLVEHLHGSLRVRTQAGVGTQVMLDLPMEFEPENGHHDGPTTDDRRDAAFAS